MSKGAYILINTDDEVMEATDSFRKAKEMANLDITDHRRVYLGDMYFHVWFDDRFLDKNLNENKIASGLLNQYIAGDVILALEDFKSEGFESIPLPQEMANEVIRGLSAIKDNLKSYEKPEPKFTCTPLDL